MEVLQQTKPKARKDHKCDWCNGIIEKGETYHYSTQVYDGEIYSWKAHKKCMELAHALKMFDYCNEGVTEQDFYETIYEEFCNLTGDDDKDDEFTFQEKIDKVYQKHCL